MERVVNGIREWAMGLHKSAREAGAPETIALLKNIKEGPECTCKKCKDLCYIPCLPLPEEAISLIRLGLAHRLMLLKTVYEVPVISPAYYGFEGRIKKEERIVYSEGCTFLTPKGLCEIHKFKPLEGRVASCKEEHAIYTRGLRPVIVSTWDSEEGREAIREWKKKRKV
jgi:hypothetical protein